MPQYHYLIAGAGFAGAVLAERLARISGCRILVVDKRPHIAGNAFDIHDAAGVLIHQYGPHIFHTNSADIARYLSEFTAWRAYEHRVLAQVEGKLLPIPINRTTLNGLYDLQLSTDEEAAAYLAARAELREPVRTSEDAVISKVGRDLYEKFFQGYTRKQWGLDPSELDASVAGRVPTRTNTDDRYFTDSFQQMPLHGFTRMFANMLDHPNITLQLGVDVWDVLPEVSFGELIFTGPIDEFYQQRFGPLPYRSLRFQHETKPVEQFQPVGVVNYPNDHAYTRITEFKHLTGQQHAQTSVVYEFPQATGEPYYPIPKPANADLYRQYQALAENSPGIHFVGRLATYRYYNMDQVVGQALTKFRQLQNAPAPEGNGYTQVRQAREQAA